MMDFSKHLLSVDWVPDLYIPPPDNRCRCSEWAMALLLENLRIFEHLSLALRHLSLFSLSA